MKKLTTYTVLGLMSGTSLDGLDLAVCRFSFSGNRWEYKIRKSATVSYSPQWKKRLGNAHTLPAEELIQVHAEYGKFLGIQALKFLKTYRAKVDFISSHGHTVFHQPEKHFTFQLGEGAALAAAAGIKTVCDLRSTDVAWGGQGAPLVPIGDELLFAAYDACLNLGGIANISFRRTGKRVAFDICPANMVLNYLAGKAGLAYDKDGKLAARGIFNSELLGRFNTLPFYKNYGSKSLAREWVEKNFIGTLEKEKMSVENKLATVSEHAAFQVARVLNQFRIKNVLVTGGGVYNKDLLGRIRTYADTKIILPNDEMIQFKEALIFAFLGVLRVRGEINALKEVTGAGKSSCGGAVYL